MTAKRYVASNYVNAITYRKVTPMDERYPRGTYHDTWGEAHAVILAKRQDELEVAQKKLVAAKRALAKAQSMKPPTEPVVGPITQSEVK